MYTHILRGKFDAINHGKYVGDPVVADNDQMIINTHKIKIGDYTPTIPFDKCSVCDSDQDLTKYGFIKYGEYWYNRKFLP